MVHFSKPMTGITEVSFDPVSSIDGCEEDTRIGRTL